VLKKVVDIPRKPKQATQPASENALTNGASSTGKRKREAEDDDLTNGHVAKKVAGESTSNGNNSEPIIIEDEGAILIDD
jgi:ubiquitin-like 1-activating enzyme E1 B